MKAGARKCPSFLLTVNSIPEEPGTGCSGFFRRRDKFFPGIENNGLSSGIAFYFINVKGGLGNALE